MTLLYVAYRYVDVRTQTGFNFVLVREGGANGLRNLRHRELFWRMRAVLGQACSCAQVVGHPHRRPARAPVNGTKGPHDALARDASCNEALMRSRSVRSGAMRCGERITERDDAAKE